MNCYTMNCYSTTDRPTKEYLQRFSDLCELANGITYLVDQYLQSDAAASQWYEIAKDRKRQLDEMKDEVDWIRGVRQCDPTALLGLVQKIYVGDMENMPRWAHHVACVALHFIAKCSDAKHGDIVPIPPEIQASYDGAD
jgi:hypothetical protein